MKKYLFLILLVLSTNAVAENSLWVFMGTANVNAGSEVKQLTPAFLVGLDTRFNCLNVKA